MDPNNTNFAFTLEKTTTQILDDFQKHPRRNLRPHQHLLMEFMRGKITYKMPRGMLVMHEMGTGKTITSISIALSLPYKIIVILSRSLVANFKAEVAKYVKYSGMKQPLDEVMKRFAFVSLNASNMIKQLKLASGGSLSSTTIVVDEAHNLFRQIINGANKNGPAFYNMVMSTPDIRLIFLTGTPINKDPYELVPCFNMLAGFPLFPQDYEEFKSLFIGGGLPEISDELDVVSTEDDQPGFVKNRPKFQNRLSGLVSYVEGNPSDFPEEKESIMEYIPMELTKQWPAYVQARLKEKAEGKRSAARKSGEKFTIREKQAGIAINSKKMSSSYRKESRSVCNAFEDVSPKIDKLLDNINKSKGKGLIYSQFIGAGLMQIANRLQREGWEPIIIGKPGKLMAEMEGGSASHWGAADDIAAHYGAADDISNIKMNKDNIDANVDGEFTANDDNSDNIGDEFGVVEVTEPEEEGRKAPEISLEDKASVEFDEEDDLPVDDANDDAGEDLPVDIELAESDIGLPKLRDNKKRFIMIYGEVKPEDRQKLQNLFNEDDNLYGEKINLFLVSSTGAEGLNLRAVRHVHIFEPFWSYSRIDQVKARARRFMSHVKLPAEERNFKTYTYISVIPKEVKDHDEPTTDQDLYSMALRRQVVIDDFLMALKETAIDCPHTHTKLNCVKCSPTNQPLYTRDVYADIAASNPCRSVKTKELKVNAIEVDGVEYKWTADSEEAKQSIYGIVVYRWDGKLKSFIKIMESELIYEKIYNLIQKELH